MRIAIHSVYRETNPALPSIRDTLEESAKSRGVPRHELWPDLNTSDAILITEAWRHFDHFRFGRLQNSPVVRSYREKVFVYCDADEPLYILPGLYPCASARWHDKQKQLGCCYLQPNLRRFERDVELRERQPDLLFSFLGTAKNHASRKAIMRLSDPQACIIDTSREWRTGSNHMARHAAAARYRELLGRSKFVLCPRGRGRSSYRLFEVMSVGRVPVIIGDDWLPPLGPDWEDCALRILEADVARLPVILREVERKYQTMASAAHQAYLRYFSTNELFDYVGDLLEHLSKSRSTASPSVSIGSLFATMSEIQVETRRSLSMLAKKII